MRFVRLESPVTVSDVAGLASIAWNSISEPARLVTPNIVSRTMRVQARNPATGVIPQVGGQESFIDGSH